MNITFTEQQIGLIHSLLLSHAHQQETEKAAAKGAFASEFDYMIGLSRGAAAVIERTRGAEWEARRKMAENSIKYPGSAT